VHDDVDDLLPDLVGLGHRRIFAEVEFAEDKPGVLLREKSLRHIHVEIAGRDHQQQRRDQRRELVTENEIKAAAVAAQRRLEDPLRAAIEAALGVQTLFFQKQRAHDRCQGQRDARRCDHGDRNDHSKLAEQPADDAAHEKQGNKDGDQ